eukprot:scaffold123202_cov17-Tisochrysis_lutea.AAC.2
MPRVAKPFALIVQPPNALILSDHLSSVLLIARLSTLHMKLTERMPAMVHTPASTRTKGLSNSKQPSKPSVQPRQQPKQKQQQPLQQHKRTRAQQPRASHNPSKARLHQTTLASSFSGTGKPAHKQHKPTRSTAATTTTTTTTANSVDSAAAAAAHNISAISCW